MPILFAVVSLVLAWRFFRQHPLLAIFGSAAVFFVFYVLMPANNPSAARFGNLDPAQAVDSPTVVPVRRALPVADQPIPVRRALPVR
jgi:lipopolysaccharide export LptBFGC system permease protein LptF